MYRSILLRAAALQQYAPDLAPGFLNLEQKTRTGDISSSVDVDANDLLGRMQRNRNKDSNENEVPNERQINQLISNHDFAKARKLVDKLPEPSDRERLSEVINAKEALYVLTQDKIFEARALAEKLQRALTIQEVYVSLISKCLSLKNDSLAQDMVKP